MKYIKDYFEHRAYHRAVKFIDVFNDNAPNGKVVHGLFQALIIAEGNKADAEDQAIIERHLRISWE